VESQRVVDDVVDDVDVDDVDVMEGKETTGCRAS
jgi:hypothetical protein